jgi:hypothetical protein
MGLIKDVTSISIDQGADVIIGTGAVEQIIIDDATIAEEIVLNVTSNPEIVEITTVGPQGPPGLKNVYVQSTAPTSPNLNDIWIQI